MAFTPKYNLIEELKWRGLFHQDMPGTEELLSKELVSGYIGFDPTADSLHIGNMVPIILLVHLQRAGHKPYALVGGATGMVGDPSGKKSERTLLDIESINHNLSCQKKQLEKFLDFDCGENSAEVVNNYDWFKDYNFLDFIREVGKHISINYMMAKDSVKNRLEEGMSFTEFSYQLVQGYDFFHLWKERNVKLQMGGSDQWGNIVTGTELIRRKGEGKGFALTAPLLTKSDGSKFGKSEGGNVWLDAEKTSPYEFYQYWINTSDEDAERLIKIFTLYSKDEINQLIAEHTGVEYQKKLQKELAKYITTWVHGEEGFNTAFEATQILFGKGTSDSIKKLSDKDFLSVFSGVNQSEYEQVEGVNIVDLLANTGFIESKSQAKRELKGNAISVNGDKVKEEYVITDSDLINGKYVLLQKGKKNKFIVVKK
ncbi:MAG: tyrosine--tRNA ligase [Bacteroidia bacterium]|nr:tyrosine--tRNA ligase [Bacteroidia bacterium]NNJ55712.1 tyrosine--tRNA ligase [Bacteroidia bacterium]